MREKFRVILAMAMVLAAALCLSGNALALPASGESGAAFAGIAYHGDPAACVMTSDQARALAAKLGELMGEYNEDSYKDGFVRRAALVDMGSGVPALYYYQGVTNGETPNPLGPGLNGTMGFSDLNCTAWEFKDGVLTQFMPGWYYDGFMVYEYLSGNGRSGSNYVVPIVNGVIEILPDEDGDLWIDGDECLGWYDWALGSMGDDYDDGYENMYAGENDEYRSVLENPGGGSALGIFEYNYVGLGDAGQVWAALSAYAQERDAADVSDPAALVRGYGDVDISALPSELLRGYARTLRELPTVDTSWYSSSDPLYNFATLLRGGDGTVLLWVVPAVMSDDWWGNEQYFTYNGSDFVGRDHLLYGWDGANVQQIRVPGVNQILYWPEGLELTKVYYGTDVDGQTWEVMYNVENGGLAAWPQWCHASGFLYGYALEEVGLGDWVPTDLETRISYTQYFFDYKTNQGQWPYLPLDWGTFMSRGMTDQLIDFDVYGGDYQTFRQSHEVYNAQYDYSYLDVSGAGTYSDIENMPGMWLLSDQLADRLDAMAAMLEEESQPPVEAAGDEDREPDGGDTDGVKDEDGGAAIPEDDGLTDSGGERDDVMDEEKDGSGDREEKKDAPVGLIAGVVVLALVVGGGAGTAVTLLSKKRREKAGKNDGDPGQVRAPAETPPQTPAASQDPYPGTNAPPAAPQVPQTPQTPQDDGAAAFCPNCGAPHAAGAKFCSKCGAKL